MSVEETVNGKKELKITFETIRDKNVEQLRILNNVLFPIKYQEKYYKECLASSDISQFACFNSISIGAIACRIEHQDHERKLYIMTLGVLAPYRGLGVGRRLLQRALKLAAQKPEIVEAYLHVQSSNEAAIAFYQKFGFKITETIPNYYKQLDPQSAVVLRRCLEHNEHD